MNTEFKIGDIVNCKSEEGITNFLTGGKVTGLCRTGRIFVLWPVHGSSSIPADQLVKA